MKTDILICSDACDFSGLGKNYWYLVSVKDILFISIKPRRQRIYSNWFPLLVTLMSKEGIKLILILLVNNDRPIQACHLVMSKCTFHCSQFGYIRCRRGFMLMKSMSLPDTKQRTLTRLLLPSRDVRWSERMSAKSTQWNLPMLCFLLFLSSGGNNQKKREAPLYKRGSLHVKLADREMIDTHFTRPFFKGLRILHRQDGLFIPHEVFL